MKIDRSVSWWKLSILMAIMLATLFLLTTAAMPPFMRKLLELAITVSGYMLVGFWIYSNASALEAEDRERQLQSRLRQPWYPSWWRPGLNKRQYHYLLVKHETAKQSKKESAK